MNDTEELFILKSAAITADLERVNDEHKTKMNRSDVERATDALIAPYMEQIDFPIRTSALRMAEFYQIFYMLERFSINLGHIRTS